MLVKPSDLTKSRLASEYWPRTPSLGFQLGTRVRCAWAAAAAEMAVRTVRRVMVIDKTILPGNFGRKPPELRLSWSLLWALFATRISDIN